MSTKCAVISWSHRARQCVRHFDWSRKHSTCPTSAGSPPSGCSHFSPSGVVRGFHLPAAGEAGVAGAGVVAGAVVGALDPGAAVGNAVGDEAVGTVVVFVGVAVGLLVGVAVGVLVGEAVGVLGAVGDGVGSPPRFCLAAAGAAATLSASASRHTCRHRVVGQKMSCDPRQDSEAR